MFDFTQISRYRENNRLEAKLATGGLPHSIWETYSAFANSYGGVILLGVEELPDHSLRVQGLLDPQGMVEELNDAHIMDCMECGACAYACPARMHLTHMFKTGKQLVKDKAAADRAAAEAKKKAEEAKEAAAK